VRLSFGKNEYADKTFIYIKVKIKMTLKAGKEKSPITVTKKETNS